MEGSRPERTDYLRRPDFSAYPQRLLLPKHRVIDPARQHAADNRR